MSLLGVGFSIQESTCWLLRKYTSVFGLHLVDEVVELLGKVLVAA